MRVLTVNVGSSSLKLSVVEQSVDGGAVVDAEELRASGRALSLEACGKAIERLVERAGPVDACGHRIVHGGPAFREPVVLDDQVRESLGALVDLAPVHLPPALSAVDSARRLLPGVPAVACFDTAFHSRLPAHAATYALPAEWRARWPLRRFGFHGLSHAWATKRACELAGSPPDVLRVVTCHLGAGASLAAVDRGVSVDTTMGFTPLDGLVMATRSGSVDPGLVLWLEEHAGMLAGELAQALERRSGLMGLAGSADMRAVLDAEIHGDEAAALAVGVYLHRLRGQIAAMTAALNGIDVLVFTGGVGEGSSSIRQRTAAGLSFLGVGLDDDRNARVAPDGEISSRAETVRTFVVRAREDLQIASEVASALCAGRGRTDRPEA